MTTETTATSTTSEETRPPQQQQQQQQQQQSSTPNETSTMTTDKTPNQTDKIEDENTKNEKTPKKSQSSTSIPSSPAPPPFDWPAYLAKTGSKAAAASCFAQWPEPPKNEFRAGYKFETTDPRNQSSRCIATVIECQGPRMRLRLDGTDDRNDFWLLCDSDLVHAWNPSHAQGRHISPPLGFGFELSRWQKFLHKLIETTPPEQFAPASCFRQPPSRPARNEFQVGDKLEAVDPKNPSLICPATVREVKADRILIGFDGWSLASQFWTHFFSRDLFPCGWCQRAGHILQPPGVLDEHGSTATSASRKSLAGNTSHSNAAASVTVTPKNEATIPSIQSANSSSKKSNSKKKVTTQTPTATATTTTVTTTSEKKGTKSTATTTPTTNGKNAAAAVAVKDKTRQQATTPKQQATKTTKPNNKQAAAGTTKTASPKSLNSSSSNNTSSLSVSVTDTSFTGQVKSPRSTNNSNKQQVEISSPKPKDNNNLVVAQQQQQQQTTPADTKTAKQEKKKVVKSQSSTRVNGVVVKSEPNEPSEVTALATTTTVDENNTNGVSTTTQIPPHVIVYVIPNGSCGPHLIGSKFHRSHTKFGPGPAPFVYKSIAQSFIDDANDPQTVFKIIPNGPGPESVRVKKKSRESERDRKLLVGIENEKELWQAIDKLCKDLDIVTSQLFASRQPAPTISSTTNTTMSLPIATSAVTTTVSSSSTVTTAPPTIVTAPLNNIENLNPTATATTTSDKQQKVTVNGLNKQVAVSSSSSSSIGSAIIPSVVITTSEPPPVSNGNAAAPPLVYRAHTPKRKHLNDHSIAVASNNSNGSLTNGHFGDDHDGFGGLNGASPDHHTPAKLKKIDQKNSDVQMSRAMEWNVDQVAAYVGDLCDAFFAAHVDMFRHHEIDGKALLLLTTDVLMKYMGFKLGPALKLNNYLDKLRLANNITAPRPSIGPAK